MKKLNFLSAMLLPIFSLQSKTVLIPLLLGIFSYWILPESLPTVAFYSALIFATISLAAIKFNLKTFDDFSNFVNNNKTRSTFIPVILIALLLDFIMPSETPIITVIETSLEKSFLFGVAIFALVNLITLILTLSIDNKKQKTLNNNKMFLINFGLLSVVASLLVSVLYVPIFIYLFASSTYLLYQEYPPIED